MFDLDFFREIVQSIHKNRTRSLLSGLTVAFAIILFTILYGIANGLQNTFQDAFADDATNAIFVYSGKTTKANKGLQNNRLIQFNNKDFDFIKEEFNTKVEYISARLYKNFQTSFKGKKNAYDVRALHPDHQFLEKTIIQEGRYIHQNDIINKAKVVVIGRLVEQDLFLTKKALGEYVNVGGISFKVVGVFKDDGGDTEERIIYMPLTTAQYLYGNNDFIDQINLSYNPEMNYDQALDFGETLTGKLKERFSVAKSDQRAIRVRNLARETKIVNQMTYGLTIIILIIGFGTLMAGIVGVSNIMIFTVKERTKEIGIRKALGASPRAIVSLILIESILITTVAGYFGLLLGIAVLEWIGPSLKTYFIKDPSVGNSLIFFATLILIFAGGLAGYFPAKKASRIKPIVALRND